MNCPSHHTLIYVSVDWFCCVCFCLAFQWNFWDVFPGGVDWNPSCTDVVVELHFVGWCLGVHTCIMYRYTYMYSKYIYIYVFNLLYLFHWNTCIYICIPFELISTYRIYPLLYSRRLVILEILPFHRGKAQCKATQDCQGGRGDEAMIHWRNFLTYFQPKTPVSPKYPKSLKDESFI